MMELLMNFFVGLVLVPAYNAVKGWLGLEDKSAAWVLLFLALLISFPISLATGAIKGIELDFGDPIGFLRNVAEGFLVILGTAEGLYSLVKKRI